jgi:PRTRC genetic system protein E
MTGRLLRPSLAVMANRRVRSPTKSRSKTGGPLHLQRSEPAKEPIFMSTIQTSEQGLFTQLEPLLAHRAVLITVSKLDGDQLQVNICPRQLKEGENPTLTVPLCVTGTAAELDTELVAQISRFVASHIGLNSNLATIEKEIAEAEKGAREEAKKKHKVVGNGGKKVTDGATSMPSATLSKPETEPQQSLSLFDQQSCPAGDQSIEATRQAVAQAD